METLNPKPSVVRRYNSFGLPDSGGDMAVLTCGHYVYVPSAETPDETAIDCGECAAEADGERSAPRVVLGPVQ